MPIQDQTGQNLYPNICQNCFDISSLTINSLFYIECMTRISNPEKILEFSSRSYEYETLDFFHWKVIVEMWRECLRFSHTQAGFIVPTGISFHGCSPNFLIVIQPRIRWIELQPNYIRVFNVPENWTWKVVFR